MWFVDFAWMWGGGFHGVGLLFLLFLVLGVYCGGALFGGFGWCVSVCCWYNIHCCRFARMFSCVWVIWRWCFGLLFWVWFGRFGFSGLD